MRIIDIIESKKDKIKNLKSDTVLTVFHGTDIDTAIEMCEQGIDARQQMHRKYPHFISRGGKNEMVNRGLFVTPSLKTALDFGNTVLKFPVLAKNLYSPFPSPDIIRKDRQVAQKWFPNSFRPEVSNSLLIKGSEPQALFRGLLSPRAIQMVYLANYDESGQFTAGTVGEFQTKMSRENFIKWYYEVYQNKPGVRDKRSRPVVFVEPQEKLSFQELIQRIIDIYKKRFGYSAIKKETIYTVLQSALSNADTYQQQIMALTTFSGGSKVIPYSVAKRILPEALKELKVQPRPNIKKEPEQYWL